MEFVRQILMKLKMSYNEGLLMKVFSHSLMWLSKHCSGHYICDHSSMHTNLMGLCASAVMWLTGGWHAMFFDLPLNKWLSKQLRCQSFERPSCSLWCHSNAEPEGLNVFLQWFTYSNPVQYFIITICSSVSALLTATSHKHGSLWLWSSIDWDKTLHKCGFPKWYPNLCSGIF